MEKETVTMKKILSEIHTLFNMILYKVRYIEGNNAGYYLIKRKFIWLLFFIPILAYRTFINLLLEAGNVIIEIFSHDSRWLSVKEDRPKKLNFKQKKIITKTLRR